MNIRSPWRDFPPVHILTPLGTASKHPHYVAAKQEGNLDAALELVTDLLPNDKVRVGWASVSLPTSTNNSVGNEKPVARPT